MHAKDLFDVSASHGPTPPPSQRSSSARRDEGAAQPHFHSSNDGADVSPLFQVDVYHHPDHLPEDARRLLEQAESRNNEFGMSWYRNLVDTVYPQHAGVRFYTLRRGRQPIAVLPLRVDPGRIGRRVASLSNFYTTLYEPAFDPALTQHGLCLLLQRLERDIGGFSTLTLAPMDSAAPAYRTLLGALRLAKLYPREYFAFGNWYFPVAGGWTDYLKTRTGAVRSTLKRMGKKFAAAGGTLEIVQDGERLEAAIAAYNSVYHASWKQAEPFPAFMPGLIQSCAANGSLRLGLAWLDGKAVAAQLWIVGAGRAAIYKVAYHEDFKEYSPGSLVTALLMEHALDVDQVAEVDYLIGDDAYKSKWMSQRRERSGIVAYNPRSLGGLAGLAHHSLGKLVKELRRRYRARAGAAAQATPATAPAAPASSASDV